MLPRPDSPSTESHLLKNLRSITSPTATAAAAAPLHLSPRRRLLLILSALALQLLLLLSARHHLHRPATAAATATASNQCTSGQFYVYDLPPIFNQALIAACDDLNPWSSRCPALSNSGFGLPATDLAAVLPPSLLPSWFATDQFAAELIYHRRALAHPCRTTDPSSAAAFFVPFYAGLAVGRHLWSSAAAGDRDRESAAFLTWLTDQQPFQRSGGWDHFIVLGRITWDFRRSRDGDWGGSLLYMPGMANVTRLLIERNPWDPLDVAVPYPTGFHPRTAADLRAWQRFVMDRPRPVRFSFAGAARAKFKDDFRGLLLGECERAGEACRAMDCGGNRCGGNGTGTAGAVGLFLDSDFCLQPRGDSFTRRSMFDCMVAGAIPVLFWRRSAYTQYEWYLPTGGGEEGEWSVFVDRTEVRSGAVSVSEVLAGIGEERVRRMRERVVEMIPRLVYAAAAAEGLGDGVMDAFDVAVEGVLRRFRGQRAGSGQ